MKAPEYDGVLRSHSIKVPEIIQQASGIRLFGKLIKSVAFTTDVAIIKNINADAIIAVYPFTPQPIITRGICTTADLPVIVGVGGGVTTGKRVVKLAQDAEFQGAIGVVVNAPTTNEIVSKVRQVLDIPIFVTVVSENEKQSVQSRLDAGMDVINVSGAGRTAAIVRKIRKNFPNVPILATGGPNDDSIQETIEAGANAITYTPPTSAQLFKISMTKYRDELG